MSIPAGALFAALADQFRALIADAPDLCLWFVGGGDEAPPFPELAALVWKIGHPFAGVRPHPSSDTHNLTPYPAAALATTDVMVRHGVAEVNPHGLRQRDRLLPLAAQAARHLTAEQLAPYCRWVGEGMVLQVEHLNAAKWAALDPASRALLSRQIGEDFTRECLGRAVSAGGDGAAWVWFAFLFGTLREDRRWVEDCPQGRWVSDGPPWPPSDRPAVRSVPCACVPAVILASAEVLTRLGVSPGHSIPTAGTSSDATGRDEEAKSSEVKPPTRQRMETPDQRRREALYECIRALKRKGMTETSIVAHLDTPDGRDLMAEVRWELNQRPNTTRGGNERARAPADVVSAALAKLFREG